MNAAAQPAPRAVPPHSPTIADVARLAGVAKTTVSYTLNDSGFVSAERRARILAAVEELGYRPNTNARALRLRTASRIGIVCADLSEGSSARIVNGIRAAARAHRLTVVLLEADADGGGAESLGGAADVDGIIVCARSQPLSPAGAAVPSVNVVFPDPDPLASPESAGFAAVGELLETMTPAADEAVSGSDVPRRHNRATPRRS